MTKRALMVVVCVAALAAFSTAYAQPACCPALNKGGSLYSELNPDQQKQVTQMKTDHLKALEGIRSEMAKKRIESLELTSKDQPDEKALQKVREDMWALQDKARNENRAFSTKFRALLTPEQREKLGPAGLGMGLGGGRCGMGQGGGFGMGQGRGCGFAAGGGCGMGGGKMMGRHGRGGGRGCCGGAGASL